MAGVSIQQFNDFVEGTGPAYVSSAMDVVNDAQKRTYSFGWLLSGDIANKKVIQGGSEIREKVFFEHGETFEFHLPGETRTWKNPQKLVRLRVYWRFAEAHMSWNRQEVMLNDAVRYGNADTRFHQYVDLRNQKERMMWTDKWAGMEEALWAEPSTAMESEGGKVPTSIPFWINEATSGLFDPLDGGTALTTVGSIDPTDAALGRTGFVPQQRTYTQQIDEDADKYDPENILGQSDLMFMDLRFEQPPTMKEYFENPRFNKFRIATSTAGRAAFMLALRGANDQVRMAGGQDPAYPGPQFNGIPVMRVEELDTATLYANSNSNDTVAEGTANFSGPRFYWLNTEYLFPTFHDEMYFAKDEVMRHPNDPDTFVCPVNTWYNVICTSRRRQGILSPAADLYDGLY